MTTQKSIALLYFSRHAQAEAREKRWFKGQTLSKNEKLAELLINQSNQLLEQVDLPIFHFHEQNQKGNSFGEKLANAFQDVFDQGFEAVIAVGNDSPEISQLDWKQITANLAKGRNVLGQSRRGGAYLLGLNRDSFLKEAFERLPWQSNRLYAALYDQINAFRPVVELAILRDINSVFDLKKILLKHNLSQSLRKLLRQLLRLKNRYFLLSADAFPAKTLHFSLRAPPLNY